ncbi:hypothetical protein Tco_0314049 [Tanacetum coccineum]
MLLIKPKTLRCYDSDCDELNIAKVALMANLSYYGSYALAESNVVNHSETEITSDSNIIPYSQYVTESQQAACQDTLTAKLERYKEQVKVLKEGQNVNLKSKDNVLDSCEQSIEIDRLKQTLSEHLKENESLMQIVTLLKNDFKKEESRNIDREIALEKKIKQLYNIIFKRDQSAQTVHMLTKPQFFYDHTTKQALGFQNPFYLKKAQQLNQSYYDRVIHNKIASAMVSKLIAENEHLKQTYKQLYDSIKPTRIRSKEQCDALINQVNQKSVEISNLNVSLQEKGLVITALKDELRKLKGKDLADNVVNKHTIAPKMLKIDVEYLNPRLLHNRSAHFDYLKHTQEEAAILRKIVEQGKSQNPLNNFLDSDYKYTKQI